MAVPRKKNKNPPVMSHEFFIQNHADILACFAIVIVMGLMSEKTARLSKVFVFLQYGVKNENDTETESDNANVEPTFNEFERGFYDIFTFLFSTLMMVVFHAVLQEYVIDKYSKRLHLSKSKTSKFNESGHVVVWAFVSTVWGAHGLYQAGYHQNIDFLWKDYPHTIMQWENKLYLIAQVGYWLHLYPELYFLKVRKEDLPSRLQYYSIHLIFIIGAYVMHFWRLAMLLLTLHYLSEGLFHASRLLYYAETTKHSALGFSFWRVVFVFARLVTVLLSILTFVYGLAGLDNRGLDVSVGNFNSFIIRALSLSSVVVLQIWLLYLFFGLLLRRAKEEEQIKDASIAAEEKGRYASPYSENDTKSKRTPKAKKAKANATNGLTTRSSSKLKKN